MNVMITKQNFSAHLIYLSFSKFSYRQNMFRSMNISPNMPKIMSFSLKNLKIAQTPMLPAAVGFPQTPALTLSRYESLAAYLIITSAFTWHKEKDGNIIKLVSESAAVVAH